MAHGLKKIGDLMPPTGNTQQTKGLIASLPSVNSKSFKTTGSALAVPKLEKLIGAVHGGLGACEQLKIQAAFSQPLEEPVAARVVRSIRTCMMRQDKSSKIEQPQEAISSALEKLGGGNRSEREARIAHRITTLLAHYPQAFKSESILKAVTEDWLDALGQYPYFAVETACKHWLINPDNDFAPKVSRIAALSKMYAREWISATELAGGRG